jgi:glycosyltransferase involved in cell wall biosynthesis
VHGPGQGLPVAVDATPLLGVRTGVGEFCLGALGALGQRRDVSISAFAVTWRRRHVLPPRLPAGVRAVTRAMPARPLHRAWRAWAWPPVEWWTGEVSVVHGTNFVVPPTRRAARVVTVHDLTMVRYPEMCEPQTLSRLDLLRRAVAEGAWVHTPSRFVAAEVVAELGAEPSRVRAVAHGIPLPDVPLPGVPLPGVPPPEVPPPEVPAPGVSRVAPSPGVDLPAGVARYVLAVGTIEPRKDYPGLVRAFTAVAATRPDLGLVLAGAPGWGSGALDAEIAASPFASRLVRTGYLDDGQLVALMAGASVLAYPSRYEGFGFPPLQAMALGVPVVATAAGAVPEVVGDGALVVAPGDVEALAGALAEVLDDVGRRAQLVERGRARAAGFSWEACADGLAHLYRSAHDEAL